mmetsp:Transcript_60211/g.152850  ORF Transcript_60211/g.152850 Transcript_60211/m.152850 type:complete len:269 (-) Transcript_60211:218-1024(-)
MQTWIESYGFSAIRWRASRKQGLTWSLSKRQSLRNRTCTTGSSAEVAGPYKASGILAVSSTPDWTEISNACCFAVPKQQYRRQSLCSNRTSCISRSFGRWTRRWGRSFRSWRSMEITMRDGSGIGSESRRRRNMAAVGVARVASRIRKERGKENQKAMPSRRRRTVWQRIAKAKTRVARRDWRTKNRMKRRWRKKRRRTRSRRGLRPGAKVTRETAKEQARVAEASQDGSQLGRTRQTRMRMRMRRRKRTKTALLHRRVQVEVEEKLV